MAKDESKPMLRVTISVNIYPENSSGMAQGNLRVEENFSMPVSGFTEMCKILGQFHDLAEKIHTEQKS